MSRYRKIDPRIWNDEKFRSLSDNAKLVFFFLLTHPHMTALGAMRATVPGLAAELQWTLEAFTKGFGEAFAKGMLKHDKTAAFVWLPNFLRYNKPESPNVVKSWSQSLDLLPECKLKAELLQSVKALLEALPEAFREALPKDFAKAMPNQEQEQEQDNIKNGADAPLLSRPLAPNSEKARRPATTRRAVSRTVPPEHEPAVSKVIGRMNELAGTRYAPNSKIVLEGLVPRLKAGWTEADCLAVVETKWRDWAGTEYAKHFNPETLFRESNFEKYLNAARMAKNNGRSNGGFAA